MEKTCSNCGNHLNDDITKLKICGECSTTYNKYDGTYGKPSNWAPLEEPKEAVNHPNHYQSDKGLEVIDIIEAFTSDLTGIEAFDTGNILKYVCRWKHKNGIEDLKKAKWYLEHLIIFLEKEND